MKTTIIIEDAFIDKRFKITYEDDIATTTIETNSPQREILQMLKLSNIKGKRGRTLGSKNKKGLLSIPSDIPF